MTYVFKFSLARRPRLARLFALGLFATVAANSRALSVPQRIFGMQVTIRPTVSTAPALVPYYLARLGAVPLRFAPPPPERTERPVPAEPVQASLPTVSPAEPNSEDSSTSGVNEGAALVVADVPGSKLLSIIPDDTPRNIRAEDIISYFQLPTQQPNDLGVDLPFTPARPAGSTLPPSSASYQQK